jgi:hypothetical protein
MSRDRRSLDHGHEADEPDLISDLLNADVLSGEDRTEIDLPKPPTGRDATLPAYAR